MHTSSFGDANSGGPAAHRIVALALVGVVLLSAVASTGIAAAQTAGSGSNTTTGRNATASAGTATNNSTAKNPINATIRDFKRANLGYSEISPKKKRKVRENLNELYRKDLSHRQQDKRFTKLKDLILYHHEIFGLKLNKKPTEEKKLEDIVQKHLHATGGYGTYGIPPDNVTGLDINIPDLIGGKLKSIANHFKKGSSTILNKVYDLAFSTPVPHNDGWHDVFGQPTNSPFQKLYQKLLLGKLYPLTNYLLGLGMLVLGLSLVVNPLISRFRALDLMINFVTFLLLYGFSWAAITLMHGITNDITVWLRPSPQEMQALVANIGAIKAAGIGAVGAYFAGAGGILATVLSLGIELGLRKIALTYFFPYVFAPLVLLVYLSPWQRLRTFASTAIWQYVNVLTMVIPMAIVLRAAAIAGPTLDGTGVVLMLTVIGLFLVTAILPFISTYFFFQVAGAASGVLKGAATGAATRVGAATNRLADDGDDSATTSTSTDSTATAGSTPSERTTEAVDASSQSRSSGASTASSGLNAESPDLQTNVDADEPTAAQVRALDDEQHRDPMNPTAMKEAYLDGNDRRSTLKQKLAERLET